MENTTKKYFTKNEALEDIKNTLESYNGCYYDLHDEVFNTDYYIIYYLFILSMIYIFFFFFFFFFVGEK